MARPKEKANLVNIPMVQGGENSIAFENRAKQELEKLTTKVAKALSDDMSSLFEMGEHTDLVFTNERHCEIKAHRCVVQTRARHLWQDSWISTDPDSEDRQTIILNGLSEKDISDFVRQLYTVNDSTLLIEDFLQYFPNQMDDRKSRESNGDREATTVADNDESNMDENILKSVGKNDECNPGMIKCSIEKNENIIGCDETAKVVENCNDKNDIDSAKRHRERGEEHTDEKRSEDGVKNGANETREQGLSKNDANSSPWQSYEAGENSHGYDENLGDIGIVINADVYPVQDEPMECADLFAEMDGKENGDGLQQMNGADCEENVKTCGHVTNDEDLEVSGKQFEEEEDKEITIKSCDDCACGKTSLETLTKEGEAGIGVVEESIPNASDQKLKQDSAVSENREQNCGDKNCTDNSKHKTFSRSQSDLNEAIKSSYSLSVPYETCNAIGQDLLRMYLQQMNCDVCLSVDGIKFLAHKCLLASRSLYFSAMLGGRWCESDMEEIELQGISAQALEQLLLFLYGGVVELCSPCDLVELFIIMDMYGVETLKSVLQFYVRKDLCHFFHKPCNKCISTASSALSICHNFHLEELEERCLKWCVKYFTKIWSTKSFAGLPEGVHQRCVQFIIESMTAKSVLDTIMECNRLSSSLPRIKWTESILYLATQLMDSAIEYTSSNFINVIRAPEFLQWGKVAAWKAGTLEEIYNSVIDSLPIDTACSAYQTLVDTQAYQTSLEMPDQDVLDLLDTMVKRCEKFLKTHIHQVARSKQWSSIGKSLQTQILQNSCYIHLDQFPDPKPRPVKRPVYVSPILRPSPSACSTMSRSSRPSPQTSSHSGKGRGSSRTPQSSAGPNPQQKTKPPTPVSGANRNASQSQSQSKQQVSTSFSGQAHRDSKSKSYPSLLASSTKTSGSVSKIKKDNTNITRNLDKQDKLPVRTAGSSGSPTGAGSSNSNTSRRQVEEGVCLSTSPARSHIQEADRMLRRSLSPGSRLPVKTREMNKRTQEKILCSGIKRGDFDLGQPRVEKEKELCENMDEKTCCQNNEVAETCSKSQNSQEMHVMDENGAGWDDKEDSTLGNPNAKGNECSSVDHSNENVQSFSHIPHDISGNCDGERTCEESSLLHLELHCNGETETSEAQCNDLESTPDGEFEYSDRTRSDSGLLAQSNEDVTLEALGHIDGSETLHHKTDFMRRPSPVQIKFIVPED